VALRPRIRAARDDIEQQRCLPPSLVRELKETGVFRMTMPRAWGGSELDPAAQLRVLEELSYADASVGWCATIGCDTGYFSAYLDQTVARQMFSDFDMVTGGNLARAAGRAVRVAGGYRVSGTWPFASGCRHADWMIGSCLVYDGDTQVTTATGLPVTRVCFFPPAQCHILDTWHTTGMRGTGSHDFTVTDVFVPEERTFSLQSLTPLRPQPLYAFFPFIGGKFGAVPLGIARAALEATIDLASRSSARQVIKGGTLTPKHPTREESYMQTGIARAEAQVGSARSYLHDQTAQIWEQLVAGQRPSPADVARYTLSYINAYTACREAVDQLYCLAGAAAVYSSGALDRLLRDMRTVAQHVLAGPHSYEMVGRLLLGAEPIALFT
jgi:alkylation response protein AidB-like acyl-CoA dehydrogenase